MRNKAIIRATRSRPAKARLPGSRNGGATKLEQALLLQEKLREMRDYAEAIIEAVPPLLVLDERLRVQTANDSFCKTFKISARETLGRRVYELGNGQWDIPELRDRKSTRLNSSHLGISYAVFCLKKKNL